VTGIRPRRSPPLTLVRPGHTIGAMRDVPGQAVKHARQLRRSQTDAIGVGRTGCPVPPPSEPYRRVSRIRLSGQWFTSERIDRRLAWAVVKENSPCCAKNAFGQR
jgi:hypothetical protein